jgi:hypothetical protein
VPSFPRTPFLACGILPPLRSGQLSLDEAEHFLQNRIAIVATLSDGVRDHPGMPFGFPSEAAFSFAGIPTLAQPPG